MDSSQQTISYKGELVDQAFAILNRSGDHCSIDQAPIIRGAVETICNHVQGVNRLTKVEYVILIRYIAELHETERYLFTSALANMIVMTRPQGEMSEADTEFLSFTTILADAEFEKDMTK